MFISESALKKERPHMTDKPTDKTLQETASRFCDSAGNAAGKTAKAGASVIAAGAAAMTALPIGPLPAVLASEFMYDKASKDVGVQKLGKVVDNAVSSTCRNTMILPPKPGK
jgi:hypothetical protein